MGSDDEPDGALVPVVVAAVDDHPLVLHGLRSYLESAGTGVQLRAVVPTVDELLAALDPATSVVLLDLHLRDGTVPDENVRRVRLAGPNVVLFTSEHRPAVVQRALEAGAVGLVLKEDPESSLVEAIRCADRGTFYASSRLAHQVVSDPRGAVRLSEKERAVLALVARGLPWAKIAGHLGIKAETARTHAYRALEKYARGNDDRIDGLKDLAFRVVADGHVDPAPPSADEH